MLPQGTIFFLPAVHATLALLSCSKWLSAKLDVQLSPGFSGRFVLYSCSHAKHAFPEALYRSGESRGDSLPEPLHGSSDDAVSFAMAMREATPLRLQGSLDVRGARCDARLQR